MINFKRAHAHPVNRPPLRLLRGDGTKLALSAPINTDPVRPAEETEMDRILGLPVIAADIQRCPDRAAYARSLYSPQKDEFQGGKEFTLRDVQVDAVYTFEQVGGLLAPIAVGIGKTLVGLLCATIAIERRGHLRSCIIVPPEVVDQLLKVDLPKARRVLKLSQPVYPVVGGHEKRFQVAAQGGWGIYVITYSTLSTKTGLELLEKINPTCFILDEAHKVSRFNAARTKRLWSFIRSTEERMKRDTSLEGLRRLGAGEDLEQFAPASRVEMVVLSGTITRKSVRDYAHLAKQALEEHSPVPIHPKVVDTWAEALDVDTFSSSLSHPQFKRLVTWAVAKGGELEKTVGVEYTVREIVREAYQFRLRSSPGVIATSGQSTGASLLIRWCEPAVPQDAPGQRMVELMRKVIEEDQTPDGDEIDYAMHRWKWLWELSCGFYNSLYWPTVQEYQEACARTGKTITAEESESALAQSLKHHALLQRYHSVLRGFLDGTHIPHCDTPMLVGAVCKRITDARDGKGKYEGPKLPSEVVEAWWLARREYFEGLPQRLSRPVRVCDYKIKAAVEWAREHIETGGLLWHHHPTIGRWIHEELTAQGIPHTYAPAGPVGNANVFTPGLVVASYSHGTGKNLQHQSHQVFVEWRREAHVIEQALGRTHRQGQNADEVYADVLLSTGFDLALFNATVLDADYVQSTTGQQMKLCYATYAPIVPPTDPRLFVKLGLIRLDQMPLQAHARFHEQISPSLRTI